MQTKSRWLFEPVSSLPRPSSTTARKSKFTRGQIREEILAAQKVAVQGQPQGTTIRTERSEQSRHRDSTDPKHQHGHHAFPKYLGGLKKQALAYIPADLHYLYHQEVDKIVQLPRSGKGYRKLNQSEQAAILNKLQAHAKVFDQRYRTNILPLMQLAIRVARSHGFI
jgi:tRNA 2-selenouridine synthase SelU